MSTEAARITESVVEQAALGWVESLDYIIAAGPDLAPDESASERANYLECWLLERFRTALVQINPKMPEEGLVEAERKARLASSPHLVENNRAFHRLLVEGVD